MAKPIKPLPFKTVVALGSGLAITFALLSFFFLFMQAQSAGDRVVGEVVAIDGPSITIVDVRGRSTTLVVHENARLRGVDTISEVTRGQRVMVKGTRVEKTAFEVEGLRVLKE